MFNCKTVLHGMSIDNLLGSLSFVLPRSLAQPSQRLITSVTQAAQTFPNSFPYNYTQEKFIWQKSGSEAKSFDIRHKLGEVDEDSLREELETLKHFLVSSGWRVGDVESLALQWIL